MILNGFLICERVFEEILFFLFLYKKKCSINRIKINMSAVLKTNNKRTIDSSFNNKQKIKTK